MSRQYGAPKNVPGGQQDEKTPGYQRRKDPEPKVKVEDASPPSQTVVLFHKNAPVDTRAEDIHHRLGPGPNQAATGNHSHNGSDSVLLFEGVILTGSKAGNTALASVIQALVGLGAKDSTT